ncbi:MAG: ribosomal protein S18-alanine N-acetyltransferase [Pseudomonadota bacterium]
MKPQLLPNVRQMQAADIASVFAIEQQIQMHPWTQQAFTSSLQNHKYGYVLEIDKQIMGYSIFQSLPPEAELLTFGIIATKQKQGYGYYFLEYCINALKQKQIKKLFLEVDQTNHAAMNLYHKMGFTIYGKRKNYYPNGATAWLLSIEI